MGKTDKELAVEIAIAYIHASGQLKYSGGQSPPLPELKTIKDIVSNAYSFLSTLGEKE